MFNRSTFVLVLLVLLAFAIPIEHKYDKLFRFYSLTLIPEGLEVSQGYEKKIFFYISDLIAFILSAIALFSFRVPLRKFFGNPLWIVFSCAFLSILASPFFNYPIPYLRLIQLFTPIALFSFISTAISDEERSRITRAILITIVAASIFQSGVAIAQYFNQGPIGLRLLGETNERTIFTIRDGSRWIFDEFFNRKAQSVVVIRASGTFPHANVFGGFMVLSIIATYALFAQSKKRNLLLSFALPLQFFAMCLSFSRSALFAWAITTFIWFGMMAYKYGAREPKLRQIGTIIALFFILTSALLFNQYKTRGGVLGSTSLSKESDEIRKFHQNTALTIMRNHPLFGLGYTQFSEGAAQYFPADTRAYVKSTAPHNIFLFLACETGLLSLAAFLFFLASLFYKAAKSPITIESATFISLLVGFLFIGFCDFYPILFQQGKLMFFLIAALASLSTRYKQVYNPSPIVLN